MLDPDGLRRTTPTFAPADGSSAKSRRTVAILRDGRHHARRHRFSTGLVTATTLLLALGVSAGAALATPGSGHVAATAALPAHAAPAAADRKRQVRIVNLVPMGDGFVASRWPRARFGKASRITVGIHHGNRRTTYLRFRLPSGGTVVSARLTLHRFGYWAAQPLSARLAASSAWSEWSLSSRHAPRIDHWLSTENVTASSSHVTFDVTDAFQYRRTSTIAVIAPVRRGLVQFASRQAPRGRPQLRVVIERGVRVPQGGGSSTPNPSPSSTDTSTDPTSPSPTETSTDPTSPSPTATTTDPTSPSPTDTTTGSPECTVSAILVPSCGRWWGIAPDQFDWSMTPQDAVAKAEQVAGRHMDIVHFYHVNGQLFPTSTELDIAKTHMLLINWKPSTSQTWAAVANGAVDSEIDAEANYLTSHFTQPFFLTIYHEPEDNVNASAGSGMTATDYAAMYRHVVLRLRADGVTNAVTVMDYMGWYKWEKYSWFNQLWPGDSVVDWIGLDPYGTGSASDTFTAHDLNALINRQGTGVPGYYDWATTTHPGVPIMLCEWGVSYDPASPTGQAAFFDSMDNEVANYPWLKALIYYDVPKQVAGLPWTNVTLNAQAEAAYRAAANSAPFDVAKWSY